jgi:MoaA/NifB/PqqE/SkfB family radical SAM enzyme
MNNEIKRLEIELTNTCNLECVLCARQTIYSKDDFKIKKILDIDKFKDFIKKYPNLKYVTLAGEYSEPTLHPKLFQIIVYLHKKGMEISLFINAETHNNLYYKKLALLFKNTKSKIYLTVCGTTEELHQKYRVNSKLSNVLEKADIMSKIAFKNIIITWIIFEYNYKDYIQNKNFLDKYEHHIFYTIPYNEYYNLGFDDISLPKFIQKHYKLDTEPKGTCKSLRNKFIYVDVDLNIYPCGIAKHNNFNFNDIEEKLRPECIECYSQNLEQLYNHNIFTVSESENEISEEELYLENK